MPKVKITNKKGLVQEGGSGVELDVSPTLNSKTLSKSTSITEPGYFILSSSDGQTAITVTVQAPSVNPGAMFIFRNASEDAHVLTSSDTIAAGVGGFQGGYSDIGTANAASGDRLTFPATVGTSIAMISDGRQYLLLNGSGTLTFAGYPH